MSYFKIGEVDFSTFVSGLTVKKKAIYNSQTNAAGNTVVDYINSKREVEVSIIPLEEADMLPLLTTLGSLNVSISFRNPHTNLVEENVNCIIPETNIDFYTIQTNKVMYKALKLKFIEL